MRLEPPDNTYGILMTDKSNNRGNRLESTDSKREGDVLIDLNEFNEMSHRSILKEKLFLMLLPSIL